MSWEMCIASVTRKYFTINPPSTRAKSTDFSQNSLDTITWRATKSSCRLPACWGNTAVTRLKLEPCGARSNLPATNMLQRPTRQILSAHTAKLMVHPIWHCLRLVRNQASHIYHKKMKLNGWANICNSSKPSTRSVTVTTVAPHSTKNNISPRLSHQWWRVAICFSIAAELKCPSPTFTIRTMDSKSCRKSQKDTARFRSFGITRAKCQAIHRPRKECLSCTEEMAHQESTLPKTSVSSARKCLTRHSSKQPGSTCQISVMTRGPHSEILRV